MRSTPSAGDEGCDALLVMNCPTALASSEAAADVVVESHERQKAAHKRAKPLLTNWLGDGAAAASRKRFADAGIPTFETPDGAVCGFMQLVHYKRAQDELMQTPPSLPGGLHFDRERANAIIAAALRDGRKVLSEVEAKALLASYGVPVVRTETVPADPVAVESGRFRHPGARRRLRAEDPVGRHLAQVRRRRGAARHQDPAGGG